MTIHRRLEATLLIASLLASAAGGGLLTSRKGQDFDLVASANPTAAGSSDTDRTASFDRARGKRVQADAVATASATCDGCKGKATAVQVIYVNKARKGTADNTANAWSSCSGCGATSVSIQVIVTRPGVKLSAQNRALAVNAGCQGCSSAAVAVQLVVVTSKHRAFSRHARDELAALAKQLEAQLGATRTKAARTAAARDKIGLAGIEAVVRDDLKPTSVQPRFALKTG
ncbi:hypothetical protein FB561_7533 [Kribbella amoyensis]|uniref:Uncharacterized protein n=1 Tax=Kribbella amoyensis TaxID=996641 RepID=A0A561B118_9ACTN|nr:hypothetical protein [Kribbella amoyensis]TWD72541.1 hypothetical protein FB561_7533 [Kribbella amoyensis]